MQQLGFAVQPLHCSQQLCQLSVTQRRPHLCTCIACHQKQQLKKHTAVPQNREFIPAFACPQSFCHCFSAQGYEVDIYESRPWIGGKVASFKDKDGNDIEMGLHVFFGELPSCGWQKHAG